MDGVQGLAHRPFAHGVESSRYGGAPEGPTSRPARGPRLFERGWDADEEHLNPMAYVALQRIHAFLKNHEEAKRWQEAYEDAGGDAAVAPEWIEAIATALEPNASSLVDGTEEG